VKPDLTNSFTPSGYSVLDKDICCTMSKFTMFITTCRVASQLIKVCFMVLSRTRRAGEKISMGGLELKTLKKLNGDKFGFPVLLIVLAKAIGRGATALCK
jgi:hypothetical protein